jgi:hypothetical protein
MAGDANAPIPEHAYDDFRYLLKLLRAVLSTEHGWRDDLKTVVPSRVWSLWACYTGAVSHYKSGEERTRGLVDARVLPEYVVSWTADLDADAIETIGRTVRKQFVPCDSNPAQVGRRWVDELNRTAFRLAFHLASDRFD